MSDNTIGGESARFMSDGLELLLENDQTVRPRLRSPDEQRPWIVTWVDPESGEVGLGPETDDTSVVLYLSPGKAVFTDDGERIYHYEWHGQLFCEREEQVFEWATGDVTCPHCGDELSVDAEGED